MTARSLGDTLAKALERVSAGSLEATIDGDPFVVLDADRRDVTVQVDRLLDPGRSLRSLLAEERIRLWQARGLPSALARAGWDVRFRRGGDDLVSLGRDASAITGHVHIRLAAVRELRRIL